MNPNQAIRIANAVANAFVIEMRTITGSEDIQMLDEAYTYYPYVGGTNSVMTNRVVCAIVVIFITCAYIVLKEILTNRLKTVRECTLGGELNLIGVIPIYKN